MQRLAALAACAALLLIALPAAAIDACPVGESDIDKAGSYVAAVEALIGGARDCDTAFKRLEACQLGSSGDNALATLVQAKCEPMYREHRGAAAKKAYEAAQKRCDSIALKNSGSMYQSFAAVCRAGAARDFAHRSARRIR
jgi:hypothetical protein